MEPSKVEVVQDFPQPQSVKEVLRFLGTAGWYHRFIPHFAERATVLNTLKKKNVTWTWSEECMKAFEDNKQALITAPVLIPPDFSKPFQLHRLWGCPSSAAACQKNGDKYVSLGEAQEGPQWESDVLVLKYTDGASCPASDQKRTTIIRFKCDREKVDSKPTLITALEDCIYNFVWFTAAACPLNTTEHGDCRVTNPATGVCIRDANTAVNGGMATRKIVYLPYYVKCSVWNGTSLLDLSPLIHLNGYYTATDEDLDKDKSPDFYINICQPLNPIPGVTCPPGAAVCMDPADGDPIGSPAMIRQQDCIYVFEWATPVVCPETVSAQGCSLKVSQLQYTFNLSALSGVVQVRGPSSSYKINVCGAVTDKDCKNSPVCLVSSAPAFSFGISKVMSLNYSLEEQVVIM
ncbi:hypothetical protein AOLI_G00034340 [Acnodon oligacanthus]